MMRTAALLLVAVVASSAAAGDDNTVADDEFAVPAAATAPAAAAAASSASSPLVEEGLEHISTAAAATWEAWVAHFALEISALTFLTIYLIAYVVGSTTNKRLATLFAEANVVFLRRAFGHVGDKNGNELICESNNEYAMHATGRADCKSLTATLDLARRQDLIGYLAGLLDQGGDRLNLTIEMDLETPAPLVMTICQKHVVRQINQNEDVKFFTSAITDAPIELPSSLVLLAESSDAVEGVFPRPLVALLHEFQDILHAVHVSDQWYTVKMLVAPTFSAEEEPTMPAPRQVVSVNLAFDANSDAHQRLLARSCELAVAISDAVRAFRPSAAVRAKAEKRRTKYHEVYTRAIHQHNAQAQRLKSMDRKVQEKLAKAKEGDAALAKWEEKEQKRKRKRQAKAAGARMVMG